jgi:hypothetical protein
MNSNFPTWYREVDLEPTEDMLKKRWASIDSLAKEATVSDIEEIIRFFLTKGELGRCTSMLNEAFQKTDTMFVVKNNERELVVLSGTLLVRIVESRADIAPFVCLGVECYSFYVSAPTHPLPDIIKILKDHFRTLSKEVRSYKPKMVPLKTLNLKSSIENLQAAASDSALPKVIDADVKAHTAIHIAWQGLRQAWSQSITDPLAVLAEETELLWLLQCGYIESLDTSVHKLRSDHACLVLAEQLASSTHFVPGPMSLLAMVEALIGKTSDQGDTETTLISAIFESNMEWRKERTAGPPTKLAPINSLLLKSIEFADQNAFSEQVRSLADGEAIDNQRKPAEIALQFYNEMLLCRLISTSSE